MTAEAQRLPPGIGRRALARAAVVFAIGLSGLFPASALAQPSDADCALLFDDSDPNIPTETGGAPKDLVCIRFGTNPDIDREAGGRPIIRFGQPVDVEIRTTLEARLADGGTDSDRNILSPQDVSVLNADGLSITGNDNEAIGAEKRIVETGGAKAGVFAYLYTVYFIGKGNILYDADNNAKDPSESDSDGVATVEILQSNFGRIGVEPDNRNPQSNRLEMRVDRFPYAPTSSGPTDFTADGPIVVAVAVTPAIVDATAASNGIEDDLTAGDIDIAYTHAEVTAVAPVSPGPTIRTYAATLQPNIGDITVTIPVGAVVDAFGNTNRPSNSITILDNRETGPTGNLTIVKAVGPVAAGDGIFAYASPDSSQIDALSLTTVGGVAHSDTFSIAAGSITVTEDEAVGWALDAIECEGDNDSGSHFDLPSRTAEIDLDGGETITCIFRSSRDPDHVIPRTETVIRNFMADRADQIVANDLWLAPRLLGRKGRRGRKPLAVNSTGMLTGIVNLVGLEGDGIPARVAMTAATSLGEIMAFADSRSDPAVAATVGGDPVATPPARFDIWLRGHYSEVEIDHRTADLGLLYLGADYLIDPDWLVGAVAQVDMFDQSDETLGTSADGVGWLAGPYLVGRLSESLLLEMRAAWGRSDNNVDPLGTYTDSFSTSRWLAKLALTGDVHAAGWRFNPSIHGYLFRETQDDYTDALGFHIPAQTISLGRLTFGPTIGRSVTLDNGLTVAAQLRAEGLWDFEAAGDGGRFDFAENTLRGRVEGGLDLSSPAGMIVRFRGNYDGIGTSDVQAYGGSVEVSIPLN